MLEEIIKNYYVGDKLFIIGTYGVGKTTFAEEYSKKYSIPFKCFDNKFEHTIADNKEYVTSFINAYPERFVADAIPYIINPSDGTPNFKASIDFIKLEKIKVLCMLCSNPVVWFNRLVTSKKIFYILGSLINAKSPEEGVYNARQAMLTSLKHFSDCYYKQFQQFIQSGVDYDIFDSFDNTFITKEVMYDRIYWAEPKLVESMCRIAKVDL